ncbi:aKG-HExxH-type peptide beta-hydroxylase [Streptomyces microflavus]|uniref:aKG-HExxH-type peptide beta-hydroxylase n=1 Tax=Streptomyces microflavus TaxID=1919 RepID=UPI003805F6A7
MLGSETTALVRAGRAERTVRLSHALRHVAPDQAERLEPWAERGDSWSHTVVAHLETRARLWAQHDQAHFARNVENFLDAFESLPSGPRVVDADDCDLYENSPYESPCRLLTPSSGLRPLDDLSPGALGLLEAHRLFGEVVREGAGVVVAGGRIEAMSANNSWTLAELDATIYMDVPESPLRVAEALLHEASHNLLFEVVRSERITLEPERVWYSPWKRSRRPAYGFIHSVYAFSQLVSFWNAVQAPSEVEERYRRIRLTEEQANLRSIERDARSALALLGRSESGHLVRNAYDVALSVPAPP